jgi:antibiotic biosynthesis monooxygenase (ABM) superfamily enzyme
MINHVVLLNWHEGVTENTIASVTSGFANLANVISEIKHYSFGANMNLAGSNYEYALVAQFDTIEEFNAYVVHPKHQHFMDTVTSPIVKSYGAVQYNS